MENNVFEQLRRKMKTLAEGIKELFSRAVQAIAEIPSLAADSLIVFRKKRKMEKRREERKKAQMKQRLPREQYERYLKREKRKKIFRGAAGIFCFAAVLFALGGAWKGIRYLGGLLKKQDQTVSTDDASLYEEITIGSTGCMLLHDSLLQSYADSAGNYDFTSVYKYIAPYYSAADFMICEFEGSLPGEGYSGYPTFRSPDVIIENIRDSGVDLQLLATNHVYDGGAEAFDRTLKVYEEKGIAYTGARMSTAHKPYYIADIQGIRAGFMDYVYETEGENVNLNGMLLDPRDEDRVNTFDLDDLDSFYNEVNKNIQDMKADGVQFIVANMHWGQEYHLEENDSQREIAQKLCDLGVDALIGGHPHCEQPVDVFTGRNGNKMFCIFSVGNALTNQRRELISQMPSGHTEDGVMVSLKLRRDAEGNAVLSDVELLPTWVYRSPEEGEKYTYYILPLDDVSSLEEKTGIEGIEKDARESYDRTMGELGPGLEKVREVLSQGGFQKSAEAEAGNDGY